MAITAVNMFYQGVGAGGWGGASVQAAPSALAGDVAGDVVIFNNILASQAGGNMLGFVLPVLDGSSTTFSAQWIDGTASLLYPPSGVIAMRNDPPAWTASTYYPTNSIVLGSGHVQQATGSGKSGTAAPSWSTSGGSVTDAGKLVWKDLGAIALSTIQAVTVTAITNLAATITISAAGTSTQIPVIWLYLIR